MLKALTHKFQIVHQTVFCQLQIAIFHHSQNLAAVMKILMLSTIFITNFFLKMLCLSIKMDFSIFQTCEIWG